MKKLVIIVPVTNEEKTIKETLIGLLSNKSKLNELGFELLINVIDDGSTDTTKVELNNFKEVSVTAHKK